MRTYGVHPQVKPETSRFPCKELPHIPGSSTTPEGLTLALMRFPYCLPRYQARRPPDRGLFTAPWLAYALPYRRFGDILAEAAARLGADVDRYSFIAVDLHHLLFAGFAGALIMSFIG